MAITAIADGQFPWAPTVAALLNYVAPGQGDGIATFGDARTRLNAAAGLLGTTAMSDGDTGATQRAKINAMIAALGMPSGAVFAYDATTDRIFGGSKSFTRSSTALWNPTGEYQEYATNVLRRADGVGALVEPPSTNKCTNFNANPTDLTGVSSGAATISLEDDSSALAADGLADVCSGNVFFAEIPAFANVVFSGSVGNTNQHSATILVRGTGQVRLRLSGGDAGDWVVLSGGYQRIESLLVPASSSEFLVLDARDTGANVYFILNQLEEGSSATTPIITSGATATRAGDELTLPLPSGTHDVTMTFDDGSTAPLASGVSGSLLVDPALTTRTLKHITARPA